MEEALIPSREAYSIHVHFFDESSKHAIQHTSFNKGTAEGKVSIYYTGPDAVVTGEVIHTRLEGQLYTVRDITK